ncbi:MAG TPA: glycosyltransferase family 39 protein [Caulifigura sp.]|nr:glycosyltransferase family 39 protein [Caulifigura sp.]
MTVTGRSASSNEASNRPDRLWAWVIVLTVVVQVGLSIHFALTASVTHDEYWHLPVGSLHCRTAKFDWEPLNPPLVRTWAGLPVAFVDQTPVPDKPIPPGEYGDRFVAANGDRFESRYLLGRLMIIALSAATTIAIARWASSLFGSAAAAVAAIIWGLSPTTIANGSIVTTDMGAALAFIAVFWTLERCAASPTWKRSLAWGLALGLAQAAKYTCVLLYPLSCLGWWLAARPSTNRPPLGAVATRLAAGLIVSLLVLNACYLFEGTGRSLSSFPVRSQAMKTIRNLIGPLAGLPMPVPAAWINGLDEQRLVMEQQHPVYLDGVWSVTGFRSYYVKAILYKTPLGTLFLFALALIALVLRRIEFRRSMFFVIPAAALLALASSEGMQLGVRYVLPSLALMALAASSVAASNIRIVQMLAGCCTIVSLSGLLSHPYELASFNELAGGPDGGRYHLVDSNLDWGQDLGTLADYMRREKIDDIGLAYFGTVDPGAMGIKFHEPPAQPVPGVYAISVNFVMGRPHVILDGKGNARAVNIGEFSYFQFFEPVARLGHSIDVYRLTEKDVADWERATQR